VLYVRVSHEARARLWKRREAEGRGFFLLKAFLREREGRHKFPCGEIPLGAVPMVGWAPLPDLRKGDGDSWVVSCVGAAALPP
jgi:hypothetical protein